MSMPSFSISISADDASGRGERYTGHQGPPLVAEAFDRRTVFEMELALTKACEVLPHEMDKD
jgi:hypothetical protein